MPLVWKPALGQAAGGGGGRVGEPCPRAAEGLARPTTGKGPGPGHALPPSRICLRPISLAPFLRLSRSPSFPPPSLGPRSSSPFFPSLPTPSPSGAGVSPRRTEPPATPSGALGTAQPAGRPPSGLAGPGPTARPAGRPSGARGLAGRESGRARSGAAAAPGRPGGAAVSR